MGLCLVMIFLILLNTVYRAIFIPIFVILALEVVCHMCSHLKHLTVWQVLLKTGSDTVYFRIFCQAIINL